jgi:hypothetical protein
MSFDIFFSPRRQGTEPVERRNPFTGEPMMVLPSVPLSDDVLGAVRKVFERAKARGPDEFGCYVVEFGDGGEAEVFGSDLGDGCMVALRGLTPDLLGFLFDLLGAADWVMFPAMEGNPAIVSAPGLASAFADSFPEVVCGSPEELGAILSDGYEAWRRYRDQVVGEGR